jgi:uncharacterized repeat protein (TIGR01451 family)
MKSPLSPWSAALLLFFLVHPFGAVQAQSAAAMPFTEGFESGSLQSYWTATGTGPYRGRVTTGNSPRSGSYHYTMDSGISNTPARVELTLTVNLAGYTNVALSFWAKGFKDSANGPPPTPFSNGWDFDGVAISPDGANWHEVQGLRNLTTSYVQYAVNLDSAVRAFGLAYNSTFRIRFNQYGQYPINAGLNSAGIGIDDITVTGAQVGVLHHFNFTPVSSPQLVKAPFPVTVTAVDGINNLVPGFNGTVNLWGLFSNPPPSATILASPSWQVGASGSATVGYSFTPTNDITVTALRSYSGSKVSLWTDSGVLLASQNTPGQDRVWMDSPLASPIVLTANNTYRIGVYVTSTSFYYYLNSTGPYTFANGTINHEYSYPGDGFPVYTYGDGYWPFVDMRYVPALFAVPVIPSPSGTFANGSWTGSLSITQVVADLHLHADDGAGHTGDGINFAVLTTNDLAFLASALADPIPLGSNLVYALNVLYSGPGSAAGVVVTNQLPPNATFVSASLSRGTYARYGQTFVWSVGSLTGTTNAVATITVTPTAAGLSTNTATISTSGTDADLSNNTVSLTNQVMAMGFLAVSPATGITASGIAGGPFTSSNQVFVISNAGLATLTWSFIRSAPWVSRSAISGSLGPGDSTLLTVSLNSATYALPPGNYFETISFTNVTSGLGSTTRLINLNISSNHPPVASDLVLSTLENTPLTVTLPGTDADNDPLTASIILLPFNGRLFQTPDGTAFGAPITTVPTVVSNSLRKVIYLPGTNSFGNGLGNFYYNLSDGRTNSTIAAVILDISATNQPPVAVADQVSVLPGVATSPFNVLDNDFDAEGDAFTLHSYSLPSLGTLTPLGGGGFTYTPNPGVFKGTDQFTYNIIDGFSRVVSATVTLNIGYLAGGDWPTLGNGPQHTGYYPGSLGTNLFIPFWTNTYTGTLNQVAAADGMVFVTMSSGVPYFDMLAALDAQSGRQLWRDDFAGGNSITGPTFDNGRLYFQRNNGGDTQLRCVEAATGAILWTAPYGGQWDWYLAPLVVGDGVWIDGGTYGGMYGFDSATGGQRFFNAYNDMFEGWTPSYYGGVVYSWENDVFKASDPVYGTLFWSVYPPSNPSWTGSMNTAAAIQSFRAVLMANSYLDCVDLDSHSVAWSNSGTFTGSPAIASNIVYCIANTTTDGQVNAYDLAGGSLLGSYVATGDTGLSGQPIATDDCLLVASSSKTYIFNLQNHQLVQTLPFGGAISLADGNLYLAAYTYLRAYTVAVPAPSNDVSIAFSPLPTNVVVLQPLTYTLTITNPGPNSATGLNVTNSLTPNVTITSAVASQGTCSNYPSGLSANLGSLAAGASATITVIVVPNTGGNLLGTAQVTATSTDPNTFNNRALAATLALPPVSLGDVSITKPNVGTTNAVFTLSLAAPSSQTITVNYTTTNGTATAGIDYQVQSGTITFLPGVTTQTLAIVIKGNTVPGPGKDFFVNLSGPVNAALLTGQGRCTILNGAGLPGQIDHFEWSPIASPQFRGEPFAVTLTAKDAFNQVVSSYSGAVTLGLKLGGWNFDFENTTLLPWTALAPGSTPYELVQFDVGGSAIASQAIRFKPNSGGPNGVYQNLALNARVPYTVEADWAMVNESGSQNGADSAQLVFGGNAVASTNLTNSRIDAGVTFRGHLRGTYTPPAIGSYNLTASFTRGYLQVALWGYFDNVSVTFPRSSTNYFPYAIVLTNGGWSGSLTVMQPAAGVFLVPDDSAGHTGASGVFAVLTNHPPVANSMSLLATEDTPFPITLTATDAENDLLTYSVIAQPTNGVLSGVAPSLTYLPNTHYWGPDNFFFLVDDGKGNSATGQVAITVSQVTDVVAAQITIQPVSGTQMQLNLAGEPYEHYRIEASEDLIHWVTVTNVFSTNGLMACMVADAAVFPQRFYRGALDFLPLGLGAPTISPDGQFHASFASEIGRRYLVLASTNLVDWVTLTNLTATGTNALFTDAMSPNRRFYRISLAP